MASFDPATAYKSDWQYMDFVEHADYYPTADAEKATIKGLMVRRDDITHPDFISLTAGLAISSMPTAFVVWNPTDHVFEPKLGGKLKTDDDTGWIIVSVDASRLGNWKVAADREKVNAA